ncbi:hypothetical protein ATE92_1203 [Ulvibacter sp. MAR_2010_11]|uniref:YheT family hydrolase n=1 Tax=Ulvibacter sp. MAR_2010_11 TaxID=1250229 RepID=UPI000C2BF4D0|nr:alpha/beta fold hydrolase [Ulvibacter sp. MAR_2010_11]PKA83057.1 hypothetical protein ATE92_1203 [Ulvibacter sp. MAR_2010_11]
MPIVPSSYKPSSLFKNGHFSTIYSAKLRPSPKLQQERERLHLPDKDFLDIDWSFSKAPSQKVAILLHGLEGSAQRTYIKGQGRILQQNSWDVAAVNYRGCSGEVNTSYASYNAGSTGDLVAVMQHIIEKDRYSQIVLIGFSLGGNVLLKYLGERDTLPKQLKKGIAISSPLSLQGSLNALEKRNNWVYRTSFLYNMRQKYKEKMLQFPEQMSASDLKKIKSIFDFDTIYTAPAHGFDDAFDYYNKNSCLQFLPNIKTPILILNAKNDTFLSPDCYPETLASERKNIYLESPKYGGHVGFHINNSVYYSEQRSLQFINE